MQVFRILAALCATLAACEGVAQELALTQSAAAEPQAALLPMPARLERQAGAFRQDADTAVIAEAALKEEAGMLAAALRLATGLAFPVREQAQTNSVRLALDPKLVHLAPEGYRMKVGPSGIEITAPAAAGIFYGGQTLLQLFGPAGRDGADAVACMTIEDQPRFAWRGLMLDCSRTFQSLDYLRATLDRMALYKLNVLHLHLTDDQGWRLEIKRYPELTRVGAFFPAKYHEPPSHQGFYRQEEMRALVAYAAARHISLVPEIEMPGHSLALLSVMPELSCTGGPFEIYPYDRGPGVTQDILCAGKEETFLVLSNVLCEVAAIFPSPFIHIGGDEAPRARWRACPLCQKRIRAEGLKNEAELQSWLNRRVEKLLAAKGKRLIGWDEILEGGLTPTAAVMSWRGTEGGVKAARSGHDIVCSPTSHCYFDYPYSQINSARVFSFDPLAGLAPEAAPRVLGVQANFWSHIDRAPELVDRQLFPRLLALAERGWSPDNRGDWPAYVRRARAQLPQLERLGVHYQTNDLSAVGGHG